MSNGEHSQATPSGAYRFLRMPWDKVREMNAWLDRELALGERVIAMHASDEVLLLVERALVSPPPTNARDPHAQPSGHLTTRENAVVSPRTSSLPTGSVAHPDWPR